MLENTGGQSDLKRMSYECLKNVTDYVSNRISAVGYTHHRRLLAKCHIQSSSDGDRDYLGLFLSSNSSNLSFSCPFFPLPKRLFLCKLFSVQELQKAHLSNVCAY
ncbi:unnamed protein product [Lactuca saligna]|uniref:Uncharacterized protein n=1 Tax=Lactuca saligna TaxID=75948 RepID=A0AA35ZQ73_LACSI|nr:unnamed protein product [Lactuca saligna]